MMAVLGLVAVSFRECSRTVGAELVPQEQQLVLLSPTANHHTAMKRHSNDHRMAHFPCVLSELYNRASGIF